jgi:RNA polymerase sigma factor (sigma-70 family)
MKTSTIEKIEKTEFTASAISRADEELFAACRRGDAAAWDKLVDRYQRLVSTIPRRAGLSEDVVEEVFQEVFLTLFEKLDDIEQPERLRSWLVTTAKFKTWRAFSREKISFQSYDFEEIGGIEGAFEVPDESPLPDAVLIEIEQQHLIRTAIDSLDERSKKIITMLYLSEPPASYAAVAAEIGVAETSISPLRARSLEKLVKLLR